MNNSTTTSMTTQSKTRRTSGRTLLTIGLLSLLAIGATTREPTATTQPEEESCAPVRKPVIRDLGVCYGTAPEGE